MPETCRVSWQNQILDTWCILLVIYMKIIMMCGHLKIKYFSLFYISFSYPCKQVHAQVITCTLRYKVSGRVCWTPVHKKLFFRLWPTIVCQIMMCSIHSCWLVVAWHDFDVLEALFLNVRTCDLRLTARLNSTDLCASLCFLSWQDSSQMTFIALGSNECNISDSSLLST
jgi:hypothetical protein